MASNRCATRERKGARQWRLGGSFAAAGGGEEASGGKVACGEMPSEHEWNGTEAAARVGGGGEATSRSHAQPLWTFAQRLWRSERAFSADLATATRTGRRFERDACLWQRGGVLCEWPPVRASLQDD